MKQKVPEGWRNYKLEMTVRQRWLDFYVIAINNHFVLLPE